MGENDGVPGADIDWALQEVIGLVATAADALGASDPAYTVSVIDVRNARLQIYRKSSTPSDFDLHKYVALAPAGVSIVFETAALSAAEIENLRNLLAALSPEYKASGLMSGGRITPAECTRSTHPTRWGYLSGFVRSWRSTDPER